MPSIFAISDIHGDYKRFAKLLTYWDRKMPLVLVGDLIDRGDDSLKVIHMVLELKKEYGEKIITIKGNHEDMFLNYLDHPRENGELYFSNGGAETCYDFGITENLRFMSYQTSADILLKTREEEIDLIRSMVPFYEFGDVLFVHAGVNRAIPDWRNTKEEEFYWMREGWKGENTTGKVIVFGHTPTQLIHETYSNDIWISQDKKCIGIDGGLVFGGQLNGIVLNEKGHVQETYAV